MFTKNLVDFAKCDIPSVATGVSRVNIRWLPFSTSDFYIAV